MLVLIGFKDGTFRYEEVKDLNDITNYYRIEHIKNIQPLETRKR